MKEFKIFNVNTAEEAVANEERELYFIGPHKINVYGAPFDCSMVFDKESGWKRNEDIRLVYRGDSKADEPKFKIGDKVTMKYNSFDEFRESIVLGHGRIFGISVSPPYYAHVKFCCTTDAPDGVRYVRCEDLVLVNQPKEEKQMKLEIYSNEDSKEPVRLSLYRQDDGSITVRAVDEDGDCIDEGNLMTIRSNGKLYLHPRVRPDLGFPMDQRGRLLIDD